MNEPQDFVAAYQKKYGAQSSETDPVKDYLAKYGGTNPPPSQVTQAAAPQPEHELPENYSDARGAVQSALQGATFGLGARATALTRAVLPEAIGGTKGFDYSGALDNEQASLKEYRRQHPKTAFGLEVPGIVLSTVATGGLGQVGKLGQLGQKAGVAKKAFDAAKLGALYGGVQGAGEADRGDVLMGAGMGAAGGALLGGGLSVAGSAAGGIAKRTGAADWASNQLDRFGMNKLAGTIGTRGQANTKLAQRMGIDEAAGFTPPAGPRPPVLQGAAHTANTRGFGPRAPGMPDPMNLHQLGPNAEGLIEGITSSPGEARTMITQKLEQQGESMRPKLREAIEHGTGVKAGGSAVEELQATIGQQRQRMDRMYSAARAATEGQPVDSPALEELMQTPSGKAAWAAAKRRKLDYQKLVPSKPGEEIIPEGFDKAQWATMQKRAADRGMPVPQGEMGPNIELPDPEMLHFMKQELAKIAKMGGVESTDAHHALALWDQVRNELPAVWRQADDAASEMFKTRALMNEARQVFRKGMNPPGRAQSAIDKSLPGFEQKIANASAPQVAGAQRMAGHATHDLLNTMPGRRASPGLTFAPNELRTRQLQQAFERPGDTEQFLDVVKAWDRTAAQKERLMGNSRTAYRAGEKALGDESGTSALGQFGRGNLGSGLKALFSGASKDALDKNGRKVNEEIARLVTSPDFALLDQAKQAAMLRATIERLVRRGGTIAGTRSEVR